MCPPFLYQFQFDAQFSHSNYTIKLANNSTVILDYMRKVRTVFCPDFLAQSYINSAFTISSACALQAFICRTHSIWFSAFSCSVTPLRFTSSGTISSMRFRAASSILAQYCLTYTQLSAGGFWCQNSPESYITADRAHRGAVSQRRIRFPRVQTCIPAARAWETSPSSRPPSGPVSRLTVR